MYLESNKFRLAHLRLDGYAPLAPVIFCPKCDFQYPPQRGGPHDCPKCGATMQIAAVTPDLVELVRAAA